MFTDIDILVFVGSLMFLAVSTISFRIVTAKRLNREIEQSGEYYLSTEDKVGYTLFDIALAIILPLRLAKKIIPKWIANPESINKLKPTTMDKVLSYCFLISSILFLMATLGWSFIG